MDEAPERLTVTVREAAKMLGVGRTLAYDLVARGDIPTIKLGDRVLIARATVEAIVRGEKVQHGA